MDGHLLLAVISPLLSIAFIVYKAGIMSNRIDNQKESVTRNETDIKNMKKDFADTLKRLHDRVDKTESGYVKTDACRELRENVITSYGQHNDLICNLMRKLDDRMEKIENKVDLKLDNLQVEINRLSQKIT